MDNAATSNRNPEHTMKWISLLLLGLALACSMAFASGTPLTPAAAIRQAAAITPKGVTATFEMPVASIELYSTSPRLHSEADHENGRALSVFVSEAAHVQLVRRLGADYTRTLRGKRIRVTGTAKRFHVASMSVGEANEGHDMTIIRLPNAAHLQVM